MTRLVFSFTTSTSRQHGVFYDGENIYTTTWGKSSNVLCMFYKYDMQGNLIEQDVVKKMASFRVILYFCSVNK